MISQNFVWNWEKKVMAFPTKIKKIKKNKSTLIFPSAIYFCWNWIGFSTAIFIGSTNTNFHISGSIELKLSDMVRGAKTSQQCTIKMAKDKATPRFSIFRNKRMKGWWPFVKLKSEEDIEREEREAEEKSKKKKKKRKHVRIEDVQYTDTSGNVYILAVSQGKNHIYCTGRPTNHWGLRLQHLHHYTCQP